MNHTYSLLIFTSVFRVLVKYVLWCWIEWTFRFRVSIHYACVSFSWSIGTGKKESDSWNLQVSRVTVRAKEAVEAAGGSVRRVHYNKLGFRALLKPEWFEKKGRLLPKPARPPPKLKDKVDSIGRLPAPTKPIPFFTEEEPAASPAL